MQWRIPRLEQVWRSRIVPVEAALRKIRPGSRIFVGTGCAEPQYLVQALAAGPDNVADTEIVQLVSIGDAPYAAPARAAMFRLNSLFIGHAVRSAVERGDADYTPVFLSEIPKLIQAGRLHLDVALVQVSPPDPFGNCSLGVSVETVKAAVEHADYVVAQVNARMPRTLGDSFVQVEQLDAIVEHTEELLELPVEQSTEVADRIGYHVSRLVPDGATIQAGIGMIPNAVLRHLADKHDLGVHTEMFSDGLIDLYEAGVVTNARKSLHRGKVVAAFCLGTRRVYDFVDNNPAFEFHPSDYVSDPRIVALNDGMVAINSALQIDLTGQVCADSLGPRIYSGIGGQADFVRGAALARQGRSIIALPSTAREGTVSRIVAMLSEGAGVVTTRGDVHYVVTEYGVAFLHGRSLRERAMALINVAHPSFRAELLERARALHYVYPDQQLPPASGTLYPERYHWTLPLIDGTPLRVRPLKPTDEEKLRRFFYGLSQEDVYYRFMGGVQTMPHRLAQPLVILDYEEKFAVAAYVGEEPDESFVGVSRWFLDRERNQAEVAFSVLPDWQGRGVGSMLLGILTQVAKEKGIATFTAEVLATNRRMMNVFYHSGAPVQAKLEDGVYFVSLRLDETKGATRRGRG